MAPWNGQRVRLSAGPGPLEDIDRDILVTRIIDARANDTDWSALRNLAAHDPAIWTDLQEATRQAHALEHAMAPIAAASERIAMPTLSVDMHTKPVVIGRIGPRSALGWLVAALVALGWGTQWLAPGAATTGNAANMLAPLSRTADAALNEYLDLGKKSGRVVAEMPERIVLESRPAADGNGYEVLYVRQVLERATVSAGDLYKLGVKEDGRTMLVPAGPPPVTGTPGGPSM